MARLWAAGELLGLIGGAALAHVALLRLPSGSSLASELAAMAALIGVCCAGMAVLVSRSGSRTLIFLAVLFTAPILFGLPALLLSSILRQILH